VLIAAMMTAAVRAAALTAGLGYPGNGGGPAGRCCRGAHPGRFGVSYVICEVQAGLLLLAAVAAEVPGDADAFLARMLGAIGWIASDGTEFTGLMARHAAWDTWTVLRRLGGYSYDRHGLGPGQPTPEGITFARAALRTWPR